MRRTTIWMIVFCYYLSQFMGILSYSYDYRTGRVQTKPIVTAYCALVSVAMFGVIPLLLRIDFSSHASNSPDLHIKIHGTMSLIRVVAILVTVAVNWTQRTEYMTALNDLQSLRCEYLQKWQISQKVEQRFEKAVRAKFIWGFLAHTLLLLGSIDFFRTQFKMQNPILIVTLAVMSNVLNVVEVNYFFCLLHANNLMLAVHEEVIHILNVTSTLDRQQRMQHIRPGTLMTQCCQLADDLDDLASVQYRLQLLTKRINAMYEIQGACVICTVYLNNVAVIYMTYMLQHYESLAEMYSKVLLYFLVVVLFFYYVDLSLLTQTMLEFEDLCVDMRHQLRQCQPCLPTLDVRLEQSLPLDVMRRTTRWLIAGGYFTSQLLGILSFCYDFGTGEVRTKPLVTAYSAIMSVAMFAVVPLMFGVDWKPRHANAPDLHIKINGLMCVVRVGAVLVTVVFNWTKRQEFLATLNDFRRVRDNLLRKWHIDEKVERNYENVLRSKVCWGFWSNIVLLVGSFDLVRTQFNLESPFTVSLVLIVSSVLNLVVDTYCYCVLNVNVLLSTINEELEKILSMHARLSKQQRLQEIRPGNLRSQCGKLADDLDDLAAFQYELHKLGHRIIAIFDVQGACVMLTVYMNNVAVIYMTYMMASYEYLLDQYSQLSVWVIPIGLLIYYYDLKIFTFSLLAYSDLFVKTSQLLRARQQCWPILDARLEESFKNFSLQLAKFPVEMKLVGLFQFDRAMAFSIFASTISNAIVLIQYDYQHNSKK